MNFQLSVLLTIAVGLSAATPSGEVLYQQRCASCHDSGKGNIPTKDALKKLPVGRIRTSMDFGTMGSVATTLKSDERDAVAAYLGVAGGTAASFTKGYCADRGVKLAGAPKVQWNGWSPSVTNTRYQPAAAAGLTIDQVQRLKLKWAYAFDGDIVAFAQPSILDRYLFVGSASGLIQALSADTGCVHWTYQATAPVRAAILAVPTGDKQALLFGDQYGWLYSLDAETGRLLWKKRVEPNESVRLTAALVAYQGTVYVGVASWEEGRTTNPDYPCCTFRGAVAALRIKGWIADMEDVHHP